MSRGLAPSDLRMPISRVRSVTATSMMFMMPMPATTSAIDADDERADLHAAAHLVELGDQALAVEEVEVVLLARRARRASRRRTWRGLLDRVVDQLGRLARAR